MGTGRKRRHGAIGVIATLLALVPGAVAGCSASRSPAAAHPPAASPSVAAPTSAALAGGACLLMDFDAVRTITGASFDVAAAADASGTYTCVLRGSNATLPDLTLEITATDLEVLDFQTDVVPPGSTAVAKLGKAGYESRLPAVSGAGPVIEVGWLSGNDRLIVLRYTCAPNTATSTVAKLAGTVVVLAKKVDGTTI